MRYKVNGKNLSLGRLMVRGKNADKRLKYLHVSSKGTAVFTPTMVARVSLPTEEFSTPAAIIPQADLDSSGASAMRPESLDTFVLPEGQPAVTGPHYLVPQIDKTIPGPEQTTATFTCNADLLRRLLTVASEVSEDSEKTIRLRICGNLNQLRIDSYTQPGKQEFCGVLKGIDYDGPYIPGELPSNAAKVEKKPVQKAMVLRINQGRKFRGENE